MLMVHACRPLTVLCFRYLASAAQTYWLQPQPQPGQAPDMKELPPFSSVPFHAANIAMHCLVTCLVFR